MTTMMTTASTTMMPKMCIRDSYNTCGFWYVNDLSFATVYDEVEGSPVGCMSLGHQMCIRDR